MQIKRRKLSPVEESFLRVSRETVDHDVTQHAHLGRAGKIAFLERDAADLRLDFREADLNERGSSMLSRSEKVASEFDVSSEDTKVTNEAIREASQGLGSYEAESLTKIGKQCDYLERRSSDHREQDGDIEKDEMDYQKWPTVEENGTSWTLAHCESLLLSNKNDYEIHDFNSRDPFLAHKLLVPYNRVPRPRLFRAASEDTEYTTTALPKRPRSPARQILPGQFDAMAEELLKRQTIDEIRKYLRESKNRISNSLKQVSNADVDFDVIVCTLVLRALCDHVTLTVSDTHTGLDIRTFVTMAVISALADLQILDKDTLDEQERVLCTEFGLFDTDVRPGSREVIGAVGSWKVRRALLEMHRPKLEPHVLTQLHRCLPWALVSPAHEKGVARFYPSARERIDEKLRDASGYVRSVYVPDLTCFHHREMPDKAYVVYKRRLKSLSIPQRIDHEQEDELLV